MGGIQVVWVFIAVVVALLVCKLRFHVFDYFFRRSDSWRRNTTFVFDLPSFQILEISLVFFFFAWLILNYTLGRNSDVWVVHLNVRRGLMCTLIYFCGAEIMERFYSWSLDSSPDSIIDSRAKVLNLYKFSAVLHGGFAVIYGAMATFTKFYERRSLMFYVSALAGTLATLVGFFENVDITVLYRSVLVEKKLGKSFLLQQVNKHSR